MNSFYRAMTILGITAVLGGLLLVQPPISQASPVKVTAVDFLNQGLEKAKKAVIAISQRTHKQKLTRGLK